MSRRRHSLFYMLGQAATACSNANRRESTRKRREEGLAIVTNVLSIRSVTLPCSSLYRQMRLVCAHSSVPGYFASLYTASGVVFFYAESEGAVLCPSNLCDGKRVLALDVQLRLSFTSTTFTGKRGLNIDRSAHLGWDTLTLLRFPSQK